MKTFATISGIYKTLPMDRKEADVNQDRSIKVLSIIKQDDISTTESLNINSKTLDAVRFLLHIDNK